MYILLSLINNNKMITSNFNSLMEVNVTKIIDKEYVPYIEDLIRMVILQVIINFMYFSKDPTNNAFFTIEFVELILYIIIGVSVYWLLFKKLFKLT